MTEDNTSDKTAMEPPVPPVAPSSPPPPPAVPPAAAPAPPPGTPPVAPWAPAYPTQASAGPSYPAAGYGPGGYGPAGYGPTAPAYPGPVAQRPTTSGRAIAVLVLGICTWLVCPIIPAIVALALSPGARREIAASGGWVTGRELVTVGVVLSWVQLGLFALGAVIAVIVFVVALAMGTPTPSF